MKFFKLLVTGEGGGDNISCSVFLKSLWIQQVTPKMPDPDWFMNGGLDDQEADSMMEEDGGNKFFYQKWSVGIIF